ncbi:MAG: YSC84-related protein [Pseudomonadota bacterium]
MTTLLRNTFVVLLMSLPAMVSWADEEAYAKTIEVFRDAGESGQYFGKSYGYAVFPTIGKGGIGIGGAHGAGQVYAQGKLIGKSTMTQVTVGFQLGGQAYSQIIFFESAEDLKNFTSGNFEFGAQATAVAITAGVSAEASTGGGASAGASGGQRDATTTSAGYRKGMAIFTVAKGGLMYEATLGGQKYSYEPLK